MISIALTLNAQSIPFKLLTPVIIILALRELISFTKITYKETKNILNQIRMGKYYDFQTASEKIIWRKRLTQYITAVFSGENNDKDNGKKDIVILRRHVSGPVSSYSFYTYFLALEITWYLMPFLNSYIITTMLFIQMFIIIGFFTFLVYLYFPALTMLVLPLIGILSGDLVRELNPKLMSLNDYEKSFYMVLCAMIISITFAWIISEISPMRLLQSVSGISGALQILFVSLIGTFIIKYGFPVLFYHTFPEMAPDYVSQELAEAGKKLYFAGSNDLKDLFIFLFKEYLLKKNSDTFQQIESYFSDYLLIASADFTISTTVMKHKQKKAMDLIKQTPIGRMSYHQLKELMVTGGDSVEMLIWNNLNARKVILENQKDSKQ